VRSRSSARDGRCSTSAAAAPSSFALSAHKYEKHFCFMFPANSLWFHLRVKK